MSKKLQEWLASEQVRLAKNSETRLELVPHATVLTEDQVINALKTGRLTLDLVPMLTPQVCLAAVELGISIQHIPDAHRTPEVCLAAVQRYSYAIHYLAETQRTPEACLTAVQRDGNTLRYLTHAQCAQPLISHWIEANWDACVEILGRVRARQVAQAILDARQADAEGAQPTYEQARA